jgi:hypothetical protein
MAGRLSRPFIDAAAAGLPAAFVRMDHRDKSPVMTNWGCSGLSPLRREDGALLRGGKRLLAEFGAEPIGHLLFRLGHDEDRDASAPS